MAVFQLYSIDCSCHYCCPYRLQTLEMSTQYHHSQALVVNCYQNCDIQQNYSLIGSCKLQLPAPARSFNGPQPTPPPPSGHRSSFLSAFAWTKYKQNQNGHDPKRIKCKICILYLFFFFYQIRNPTKRGRGTIRKVLKGYIHLSPFGLLQQHF